MKKLRENKDDKITRRNFFNKIWALLGTIAGIEILGISFSLFRNTGKGNIENEKYFIAGRVDEFKLNSVTPFRNGRFYLSRMEDGGFLAMSIKCTHLGCSVSWNESKEMFICPCHSSSFEITGNVQSPPAPRSLDYYPIKIENGVVKVNTGKVVKRSRFSKEQVTYVEA